MQTNEHQGYFFRSSFLGSKVNALGCANDPLLLNGICYVYQVQYIMIVRLSLLHLTASRTMRGETPHYA